MIGLALLAFGSTLLADFAWSNYMMNTADRKPHHAALWSAAIIVLGTGGLVALMGNRWMVIPEALGAYCGTYIAVKWEWR